jgi:tetratricopeptide (TPR) repeat protein
MSKDADVSTAQNTQSVTGFDQWSALPAAARALGERVAVHPGSWIPVGAAAAAGAIGDGLTRRYLDALVRAGILEQDDAGRYRLTAPDPTAAIDEGALDRVLSWYLHTARNAVTIMGLDSWRGPLPDPLPGVHAEAFADFAHGRAWLHTHHDVLAVAGRAAAATGRDQIAWQLPALLHGAQAVWHDEAPWALAARLGRQAAERCGDKAGLAVMLESDGKRLMQVGDVAGALGALQQALDLRVETGDEAGQVRSLNAIGLAYRHSGEMERAVLQFQDTLDLARQIGDEQFATFARMNLGAALMRTGRAVEGESLLRHALDDLGGHGQPVYEANALADLGEARRVQGDLVGAEVAGRRAVALAQDTGVEVFLASCLAQLAHTLTAAGRPSEAINALREAASIYTDRGRHLRHAVILDQAADLYHHLGMGESADAARRTAADIRHLIPTGQDTHDR